MMDKENNSEIFIYKPEKYDRPIAIRPHRCKNIMLHLDGFPDTEIINIFIDLIEYSYSIAEFKELIKWSCGGVKNEE